MSKNTISYLLLFTLFGLLKIVYKNAQTDDLLFLLKPINRIIELATATKSSFIQGKGYYNPHLSIVIDKSCSGFNFMLISFLMLSVLFLKYSDTFLSKILFVIASFVISYVFSVLVNSSRIYTSIIIQSHNHFIKQAYLHEGIGVTINLTFLLLLYLATERTLTNIQKKS